MASFKAVDDDFLEVQWNLHFTRSNKDFYVELTLITIFAAHNTQNDFKKGLHTYF